MTARYRPVMWNPAKRRYDARLLAGLAAWIAAHMMLADLLADPAHPHGALDRYIQASGLGALLLLGGLLCIGPLARLDRRFLPLLYNRRHLGVVTALLALSHAVAVLAWHFGHAEVGFWRWLVTLDLTFGQAHGVPFVPLGIAALVILLVLAATSHDFWLAFLTPPGWKALHMASYAAFALAVGHFLFGAAQGLRDPALPLLVAGGGLGVVALHLAAARVSLAGDVPAAPGLEGWIEVTDPWAIPEGRAVTLRPEGAERIAVFRTGDAFHAIAAVCTHQNGPLGEGCVIDGLVTCPWHGFQFGLADGRAPAPFTDRVAIHALRWDGARLLVDPRPA